MEGLDIPEEQLARTFQVARDSTPRLAISRIVPGSQAETLNLMAGDIILTYNGNRVLSTDVLIERIAENRAPSVEMVILRDGEELAFSLKKGKVGIYTEQVFY